MSGNHTPTPWTQYQLGTTIYGADGFYVGITQSKNPEADAELIVTAVNSYASSQAEIERLKTLEAELWRLSLVIESAVRNADRPNHDDVLALIKSIKRPDAALSGSKE